MNPQFTKEFRSLLFPCCVAVTAAVLIPLGNFLIAARVIEGGVFVNFILGLMVFTFFSSLLAIAASPFGTEFHNRTLPLLLSQPIPRGLIWKHKLIAASLSIGIALLVLVLCGFLAAKGAAEVTNSAAAVITLITPTAGPAAPAGISAAPAEAYARRYGIRRPGTESTPLPSNPATPIPPSPDVMSVSEILLTACALLLPTLGSATFWTLLARSTLGGMVFTAFSQLLVFGILAFIAERLGVSNYHLGIRDLSAQTALSALASTFYGGIFFALSWRKFSRLEVSQLLPDTLAGSKSLAAKGLRSNWLRCRPNSGLLNLVRKEIQLQRPLFILAGILIALWVLAYILLILQPSHASFPEIVSALSFGFYIPLMALLAGCVSLGEEKNLRLTAWHLTFPISIARQWAVKFAIGFATWLVLGLVLPFGLVRLGWAISHQHFLGDMEFKGWIVLSPFATGVFALSFWAMTLFSNTVRAVIASLAIASLLCCSAALAHWLVAKVYGLQTFAMDHSRWDQGASVALGLLTVLFALVQSLIQFRRLQTSSRIVVKYSVALIAFMFCETFYYFLIQPFS